MGIEPMTYDFNFKLLINIIIKMFEDKINLNNIKETDIFRIFFIKLSDSYYRTLLSNKITNLLLGDSWLKSIKGFYVNKIGPEIRISYFTDYLDKNEYIVKQYIKENNLDLNDFRFEIPQTQVVSLNYGGKEFELRYRKYLITFAPIGLELLIKNSEKTYEIFKNFRDKNKQETYEVYKTYFESFFENNSPFYKLLKNEEKNQFWLDFANNPSGSHTDWAHLFFNMILIEG